MSTGLAERVEGSLRAIPDFPEPGVLFRDITPLLAAPSLFSEVIDAMSLRHAGNRITHVVGIESRGFMFGVPVAMALRASFAPVRKPGRLPYTTIRETYALEYRSDALELHADAFSAGARVLIVDDVLATGGTAAAAATLVERLGGTVVGMEMLAEIGALGGRQRLSRFPVHSIVLL
jgi:adenine phosphoribosyltransferase